MPLQATSGAASYDAFGGGVPVAANYIEDVFSTWLYNGNSTSGGTQVITNNIDLSTKSGMVWIKARNSATNNMLYDTARGAGTGSASGSNKALSSQSTSAEGLASTSDYLSAFSTTGFSVTQGGLVLATRSTNYTGATYASWTFRKQPKFFDVVTFTTPASGNIVVPHSLGSTPGCVITKAINITQFWIVNHRSLSSTDYLTLNSTSAQQAAGLTYSADANNVTFQAGYLAASTAYVMYLYAHDAGGFGLTGTDNVISCGSYTGNGVTDGPTVTVGFEPQWVMIKRAIGGTGNWRIIDTFREFSVAGNTMSLFPNTTGAENTATASLVRPTATGFKLSAIDGDTNAGSSDYIYIAIRRGPMKVPTVGTSVYSPLIISGTSGAANTTGFPIDLQMLANRASSVFNFITSDRLRGVSSNSTETGNFLVTSATSAEDGSYLVTEGWNNTAYLTPSIFAGTAYMTWNFGRAPSFFDEVCYTGTGANRTVSHNLGVVPELILVKKRNFAASWQVYSKTLANTEYLVLNTTAAKATGATRWNSTTPTSSVFSLGTSVDVNQNTHTFVAYLFATCAGVSKVGSYTGTAALQTVNCGFTAGARFVMIKRTDSTGDWYVYDSVRGITAGNDPYIFANDGSVEVTSTNYVDTDTTGFKVTAAAPAGLNASGGTYIFLAIA